MKYLLTTAALALALAAPAIAQTAAPAAPVAAAVGGPRGMDGHRGPMMFATLSPAGQTIMRDAWKSGDPKADHAAVKASRDQILVLLDADKLDVPALKRAMDAERSAAEAMHAKRQATMFAAYQKLSVADRKALVAEARAMRDRMEARMGQWKGKHGGMGGPDGMDHGDMGGMDGMMPPPPPKQ